MDNLKISKEDDVATCLGKQIQRRIVSGKKNVYNYKCQFCRNVTVVQSFDHEKIWWMWPRRTGSGPLGL